jgi:hypothetical protein
MLYDSKRWDKERPAAAKAPTTLRECKTAAEMIALAKTKPPHAIYSDEFMVRVRDDCWWARSKSAVDDTMRYIMIGECGDRMSWGDLLDRASMLGLPV